MAAAAQVGMDHSHTFDVKMKKLMDIKPAEIAIDAGPSQVILHSSGWISFVPRLGQEHFHVRQEAIRADPKII